VAKTRSAAHGVNLDFDRNGKLIGIEIFDDDIHEDLKK
jgi:uncharacterized protein YuzE